MDSLSACKEFLTMNKERNFEIINNILSMSTQQFYNKEEIKSELEQAINGCDYISAVIGYLWTGYGNRDPKAADAFKKIFFDDLKAGNPEAFSLFSFYFMNYPKRRGFDRRIDDSDRRTSYSLDYFSRDIIERRTGIERRQKKEHRSNWTRITKWASVPFKVSE
jgi:hypothetical protein